MKKRSDWANDPVDASYLLDSGLLFEINRQFLHQLGLGLTVRDDGRGGRVIGIKDERADPGSLVFGREALEEGRRKFVRFLRSYGSSQMAKRERKLKLCCQHVDPSWD